jgi:hypothetical protein
MFSINEHSLHSFSFSLLRYNAEASFTAVSDCCFLVAASRISVAAFSGAVLPVFVSVAFAAVNGEIPNMVMSLARRNEGVLGEATPSGLTSADSCPPSGTLGERGGVGVLDLPEIPAFSEEALNDILHRGLGGTTGAGIVSIWVTSSTFTFSGALTEH